MPNLYFRCLLIGVFYDNFVSNGFLTKRYQKPVFDKKAPKTCFWHDNLNQDLISGLNQTWGRFNFGIDGQFWNWNWLFKKKWNWDIWNWNWSFQKLIYHVNTYMLCYWYFGTNMIKNFGSLFIYIYITYAHWLWDPTWVFNQLKWSGYRGFHP